jgi:phospholipase C
VYLPDVRVGFVTSGALRQHNIGETNMPNGKQVGIASVAFPNVFLRLDGRGVIQQPITGSGVVNAQYTQGPWEVFVVENNDDGTVSLASVQYPGVYVRLDGTGVTQRTPGGGGVVNAQFGIGATEKFQLEPQDDGSFAFLSAQFPLVYLRLDGTGLTRPDPNGGGVVNAQYTATDKEMFWIR